MYEVVFPPVSNRADWVQGFELINDDTGEPLDDLSGLDIRIEVKEANCYGPVLTATTSSGKVTDQGGGVFQWSFDKSELSRLGARTYQIGATIERDGVTTQFLIGTLPIVDGIVSR